MKTRGRKVTPKKTRDREKFMAMKKAGWNIALAGSPYHIPPTPAVTPGNQNFRDVRPMIIPLDKAKARLIEALQAKGKMP